MENSLILFNVFLISTFFFFINPIAQIFNLYDFPEKRKIHVKPIPVLGGLIIYLIFFLNFLIFKNVDSNILLLSSIYFFIGLIDDAKKISATFRLIFLTIVTIIFLNYFSEFNIKFLHFDGMGKIYFYHSSIAFTVLCILLFQNAMNMFDGLNGQSGLIFLIIMFFLVLKIGYNFEFLLLIVFLIIFIFFNLRNKIFLGDSGVYFLSSFTALNIIKISNINLIFSQEIFLIMMLPGLDMLRLFIIRIASKRNPFKPDKFHVHHLIYKKTNSLTKTLIVIVTIYVFPIILSEFTYINKFNLIIFGLLLYLITIYYCKGFKLYKN